MSELLKPNLTVKEAASYLNCGLSVMYRLCSDPDFYPAFTVPNTNKLLVNRHDFDTWIAEQQKEHAEGNRNRRNKHMRG